MVYFFLLNKFVKYDENENVSNLEWGYNIMNGDVLVLEIQEIFGFIFFLLEQDIVEYRYVLLYFILVCIDILRKKFLWFCNICLSLDYV